jgi:hypothetical protein
MTKIDISQGRFHEDVKNLDISKKCKEEHSKSGELTELEAS